MAGIRSWNTCGKACSAGLNQAHFLDLNVAHARDFLHFTLEIPSAAVFSNEISLCDFRAENVVDYLRRIAPVNGFHFLQKVFWSDAFVGKNFHYAKHLTQSNHLISLHELEASPKNRWQSALLQ